MVLGEGESGNGGLGRDRAELTYHTCMFGGARLIKSSEGEGWAEGVISKSRRMKMGVLSGRVFFSSQVSRLGT